MKLLTLGRIIAFVGIALVIIGAFLSWGAVGGQSVIRGIEGDGIITLVIAVIALVLLLFAKVPVWISLVLAVLISGIGIIDFVNISGQASLSELFEVTAGAGMYLTVIGGIVLLSGTIVSLAIDKKA